MIDTHCHVLSEYFDNISDLILKMKSTGIKKIIVNGTDMKSNLEVLELVKKYDIVYGAIGFHPTELESFKESDIAWLEAHICSDKIVALGEIGLDYHYEDTDKNKQQAVFKRQLDIAKKYKKPIIVHSRDAMQDTYDILKEYKLRGSLHCYSGSLEMAREFIKLGFYIGVGGIVTYKNARKLGEIIRTIPLEYLLLETDSPYLSPEPKRGEKNTPENVIYIANKIAEIKNIEVKKVANITTENAFRMFDF